VAAANAKLASYETVKYYAILPEDFTVENELLTPTLKIRRRQINRRYASLFEGLYRPTKSEASVSGS
jgi:long-chain acyl-CoA synthetase